MPEYKIIIKSTNQIFTAYNKIIACDIIFPIENIIVKSMNVLAAENVEILQLLAGVPIFSDGYGYLYKIDFLNKKTTRRIHSYFLYEIDQDIAKKSAKIKYFDEFLLKDERYIIEEI